MAADNRRDHRNRYPADAVDGSLARDPQRLPESDGSQAAYERQLREQQAIRADKIARRRKQLQAQVRQPQEIPLMGIIGGVMVVIMAFLLVNCHVQINAISGSIVSMRKEIEKLEAQQADLQAQYEQAFDLTTVKEQAEAAGMRQPSDGQIYYVDLPGEDRAVACGESAGSGWERFLASLSERVSSVLEYLS